MCILSHNVCWTSINVKTDRSFELALNAVRESYRAFLSFV